jgi:hypothetical protein
MTLDLPIYVYITFFTALIFVLLIFYYASSRNKLVITILVIWGLVNCILAYLGFYENTKTVPPRLLILIAPIILFLLASMVSIRMRDWLANLDLKKLTFLHTVRAPIELVLFWLFAAQYIPELMTFEGRNYDILAGISAPIVGLVAFKGKQLKTKLLWIWNIASFLLITNIVVNAVLSIPTVFQKFAFDQPNIAVIKMPFLLLPAIIVLLVYVSNVAAFVILWRHKKSE